MKFANQAERLLAEFVPLMRCGNRVEFMQRLQWLSEGMLGNHLDGIVNYKPDQSEIETYKRFKEGRTLKPRMFKILDSTGLPLNVRFCGQVAEHIRDGSIPGTTLLHQPAFDNSGKPCYGLMTLDDDHIEEIKNDEKMVKVKVSDLSGAALDWAECMASEPDSKWGWFEIRDGLLYDPLNEETYSPSTNPAQSYPIIHQEKINIVHLDETPPDAMAPHKACVGANIDGLYQFYGPTPLVAAIRCYVASKLGDEVEIPSQLLTPIAASHQQPVDESIDASDAENSLPDQPSGG
jgi:Protein of unknown function (DUF2591)